MIWPDAPAAWLSRLMSPRSPVTTSARSSAAVWGWAGLFPGLFGLLDLGRQRADVGQRPLDPASRHVGRAAPGRRQRYVPGHRAFRWPERPGPVDRRQLGARGVIQPDTDGRAEQA